MLEIQADRLVIVLTTECIVSLALQTDCFLHSVIQLMTHESGKGDTRHRGQAADSAVVSVSDVYILQWHLIQLSVHVAI